MQNAFSQEELYTVGPHFKGAYFLDYFVILPFETLGT